MHPIGDPQYLLGKRPTERKSGLIRGRRNKYISGKFFIFFRREMAIRCRSTPQAIQRQLRREAHFGCALCGCPILDNAHSIPFNVIDAFIVEDMVALCPTCHNKADVGEYTEQYLREIKNNPFAKVKANEAFVIEADKLTIHLGSCYYTNTYSVLIIDDFEIISLHKLDGYLDINVNFFDKYDNWIGVIGEDNKWTGDTSLVWEFKYVPQHLAIKNPKGGVVLDMVIRKGEVFMTGRLYYHGVQVKMTDTEVSVGENRLNMQNVGIANSKYAINYDTSANKFLE